MDQHYHPVIFGRLTALFAAADWERLVAYLDSLSNAHFRTAGYIIGERLMCDVGRETFWTVMLRLTVWQSKAFLVTMAKAAVPRLKGGTLSLEDDGFARLAALLAQPGHEIDREKLLRQWLPAMSDPNAIERLFDMLAIHDARRRLAALIRVDTLAANYVLLRTLRFEEHDHAFLVLTCRELMHRQSNSSYNLASLVRAFFGLDEVRGVFSLTLEPYEIARADSDFAVFARIVQKV